MDWVEVADELRALAAAKAIEQAVLSNALAMVSAIEAVASAPNSVRRGYRPTASLIWEAFELEVFEDHVEAYAFTEGGTDIHHFDHRVGEPVPRDLTAMIERALGRTASSSA